MENINNLSVPHSVLIQKGKNTVVTDVTSITKFDDDYIELLLSESTLCLEGQELKIVSFSNEKKEVAVSGEVFSVSYLKEKPSVKTKGFLKRFICCAF